MERGKEWNNCKFANGWLNNPIVFDVYLTCIKKLGFITTMVWKCSVNAHQMQLRCTGFVKIILRYVRGDGVIFHWELFVHHSLNIVPNNCCFPRIFSYWSFGWKQLCWAKMVIAHVLIKSCSSVNNPSWQFASNQSFSNWKFDRNNNY